VAPKFDQVWVRPALDLASQSYKKQKDQNDDGWVAVEVKRVATIEAVEQLSRYLDCIRADPSRAACRGYLVAQQIKPQATALAESRGIDCVEVDLAVLRGEREPELTLFVV
jgi:RecB family endonuclease NucS